MLPGTGRPAVFKPGSIEAVPTLKTRETKHRTTLFPKRPAAARVEVDDGLPEVVAVEVGVYLRRRDGFVAEHLLHGPQIGPALDEVRRKGVPERMGADLLFQTSVAG